MYIIYICLSPENGFRSLSTGYAPAGLFPKLRGLLHIPSNTIGSTIGAPQEEEEKPRGARENSTKQIQGLGFQV